MTVAVSTAPVRHPKDPEPIRCSKAAAVLALGIVAVITAPLVAGVVPAVMALVLARQARADIRAGEGFLTGGYLVRTGINLAWIAVVVAAFMLVIAAVNGLLYLAPGAGQDFAPYTT